MYALRNACSEKGHMSRLQDVMAPAAAFGALGGIVKQAPNLVLEFSRQRLLEGKSISFGLWNASMRIVEDLMCVVCPPSSSQEGRHSRVPPPTIVLRERDT